MLASDDHSAVIRSNAETMGLAAGSRGRQIIAWPVCIYTTTLTAHPCLLALPADPAPNDAAQELKLQMPEEQRQWLADVDIMQAAFRHARKGGAEGGQAA